MPRSLHKLFFRTEPALVRLNSSFSIIWEGIFLWMKKFSLHKCPEYIPNLSPSVGAACWEGIRREQITLWSSRWHPTTQKLPGAGKCNKYITSSACALLIAALSNLVENWGVRNHSFTNPVLSLFVVPVFWDEKRHLQLVCSPRSAWSLQPTECALRKGA